VPCSGRLVIGLGGLIEPRALGVGYDIIEGLLNNKILTAAVVTILLVKAGIWLVALSSGTSDGVLAPLLIFGGALGRLVGPRCPVIPASGPCLAWRQ
jgi:CIC family chloride channel protein